MFGRCQGQPLRMPEGYSCAVVSMIGFLKGKKLKYLNVDITAMKVIINDFFHEDQFLRIIS
jgi:hypothetical protein